MGTRCSVQFKDYVELQLEAIPVNGLFERFERVELGV